MIKLTSDSVPLVPLAGAVTRATPPAPGAQQKGKGDKPVITVSGCNASWHSCWINGYSTTDPDGGFASTFTYVWDFGDGTTGTGVSKFHRWPAAGTYTVKLTVTDDEGTSATVTKNVTVP